ncbi:hypothetical protein SDRG_09895 [Saprolegnia diclina VS20]|uniref:Uncharacterized protein n=1 Tax=Saprolegnia diclina (strain VS20) TaxID=1156394 RepID=T0RR76_SAPDV|nr:hypothetical protein SDRG_09895 [Saprolegnia diclina VS20]EQC32577.1 hypothetical protein SDRG_09895 [Saprolegnia diclina VS20]|eukprot:XP_008614078.1 hypothetical protein SDRG_09895 [Saprolegnia diclina VS20]
MHRAEKTSSKVCRDRELEVAKAIHRKKLQETRSAIDTHKPRTSTMYHLLHNMKREREVEDRLDEIERHNNLLVNRMSDVMHCSAWEFHPSPASSVNTVSYTVYHSPRHPSPLKPSAPSPLKKSLNGTFRTQRLRQIQSDNLAITRRVRKTKTHYKNTRLRKEWQQSVKYLKSICNFPLLKPSPPATTTSKNTIDPTMQNARAFMQAQTLGDEEDDLLQYYNLSLPTINVKVATPPTTVPPKCRHKARKPAFEPKKVGTRPGLPVLDHLSPRFKWGPSSEFMHATPKSPMQGQSHLLKKGRTIDGVDFVVTVASAPMYGMTISAHDGSAETTYELYVSKDDMLGLLKDVVSIEEEFAVETISRLLCDRVRFEQRSSMLYLPLNEVRSVAGLTLETLFCLVAPCSIHGEDYTVSVSSAADGVRFDVQHTVSRQTFSLELTTNELQRALREMHVTASTVDAAVRMLLPCILVDTGAVRLCQPPTSAAVVVWETGHVLQGTYYICTLTDRTDGTVCFSVREPHKTLALDSVVVSELPPPSATDFLPRVLLTPSKKLLIESPGRPTTADHADTVLFKLAEMENDMRQFIEQHYSTTQLLGDSQCATPAHGSAPKEHDDDENAYDDDYEAYENDEDVPQGALDENEAEDDEAEDDGVDLAAMRIQAHIRGALARRNTMELRRSLGMRVDSYASRPAPDTNAAATRIQAHFRGALTRRHARSHSKDVVRPLPSFAKPMDHAGICRIQAHIRGTLVRKSMRTIVDEPRPTDLRDVRCQAATQIQARFRGTLVRQLRKPEACHSPLQEPTFTRRSFRSSSTQKRSFRGSRDRRNHDDEHDTVDVVERPPTPKHVPIRRQLSASHSFRESM